MESTHVSYTEEKFYDDCERLINILSEYVELKKGNIKPTVKPKANMSESLKNTKEFAEGYLNNALTIIKSTPNESSWLVTDNSALMSIYTLLKFALTNYLINYVSLWTTISEVKEILEKEPVSLSKLNEKMSKEAQVYESISNVSCNLYYLCDTALEIKKEKSNNNRQ